MMWHRRCESEEVIPIASQQQAVTVVGELENRFVGGIAGKGVAQERDLVTELLQQVAQAIGHVVVEPATSLRSQRHPPGNEQIDLSPVVLMVSEALVNLSSGELRKAVFPQRIDGFAVLQQPNDVVDRNPGAIGLPLQTPAERTM